MDQNNRFKDYSRMEPHENRRDSVRQRALGIIPNKEDYQSTSAESTDNNGFPLWWALAV